MSEKTLAKRKSVEFFKYNSPGVFRAQMDILEILQLLNKGTAMLCCKGRKEPFQKLFYLKLETMEIQQFPITSKKSPQPEEYGITLREMHARACIIIISLYS